MSKKNKKIDSIPNEFTSYEEAAEFWASHDTTDYPDAFEDVKVKSEFKERHFEIEVDEDVLKALRAEARKQGVSTSRLASEILRRQMSTAT
ncbi:hypothetical protein GWO43_16920 [candidate division KSB1 bacterium]|nr:hypothetical protein [candidate division KSB1 bacterium]NIR69145.1 hypothetical protein [candidate division KSB1 bacterium]NIS25656.1 hypothetical protein [candidate division KSB1 bacterium]NIT72524.1 hypothetical protein [candidate division KSB1 bacterium]NIU26333.1 hypothetical protein [candidate division KSB1 bacterium]